MAQFSRYLTDLLPRTGRVIRQGGETWNRADWGFLEDLSDPAGAVFRGRGFFWSAVTPALSQSASHYYAFTMSLTRHTAVYIRDFSAAQGPMILNNIIGASYSGGTAANPINLFAGKPSPDMTVLAGVTGVTGGTTIPVDKLFSAGNKTAVAGGAGLPTIFPPGTQLVLQVFSNATGSNEARLALGFSEITIPDGLV